MKLKTAELIELALDWAVAKALGKEVVRLSIGNSVGPFVWEDESDKDRGLTRFAPSFSWSQGGPLIESHRICIERSIRETGYDCGQPWRAGVSGWGGLYRHCHGPSALIAACRTIVAAKLGDEVNVPDELIPALIPVAPITITSIVSQPTGFRNGDIVCSLPDSDGGEV
jgi:hypothetical protein